MSKINEAAEVKETAAENQTDTAPAEKSNGRNGKPRKNPFRNKKFKYGGLSVLFTVIFIVAVVLVNVIITLLGDRFIPIRDFTVLSSQR